MPPLGDFLSFAVFAVVVVVIPGPSVLFTISRALTMGRRTALLNVVGNAVGVYAQVVAVALGVGALVERSVLAFTALKYVGAAYVVYLGVQAVRHRRSIADALGGWANPVSVRQALRDGVIVGLTNPKTIVIFVAVLPGFADPAAGSVPLQLLAVGTLFPVVAVLLDSVWATAAGALRSWLARSPRRLAAIGGTGGLMMIGIGVSLAATGRKD